MNPFVIKTAIPFGYMFFFGVLLVMVLVGIGIGSCVWEGAGLRCANARSFSRTAA